MGIQWPPWYSWAFSSGRRQHFYFETIKAIPASGSPQHPNPSLSTKASTSINKLTICGHLWHLRVLVLCSNLEPNLRWWGKTRCSTEHMRCCLPQAFVTDYQCPVGSTSLTGNDGSIPSCLYTTHHESLPHEPTFLRAVKKSSLEVNSLCKSGRRPQS